MAIHLQSCLRLAFSLDCMAVFKGRCLKTSKNSLRNVSNMCLHVGFYEMEIDNLLLQRLKLIIL